MSFWIIELRTPATETSPAGPWHRAGWDAVDLDAAVFDFQGEAEEAIGKLGLVGPDGQPAEYRATWKPGDGVAYRRIALGFAPGT